MLSSLIEGSNLLRLTDPELNLEKHWQEIYQTIWNGIKSREESV